MAAHDECCSCDFIRREAGKQACYTSVTLLQQAGTAKGQGKLMRTSMRVWFTWPLQCHAIVDLRYCAV